MPQVPDGTPLGGGDVVDDVVGGQGGGPFGIPGSDLPQAGVEFGQQFVGGARRRRGRLLSLCGRCHDRGRLQPSRSPLAEPRHEVLQGQGPNRLVDEPQEPRQLLPGAEVVERNVDDRAAGRADGDPEVVPALRVQFQLVVEQAGVAADQFRLDFLRLGHDQAVGVRVGGEHPEVDARDGLGPAGQEEVLAHLLQEFVHGPHLADEAVPVALGVVEVDVDGVPAGEVAGAADGQGLAVPQGVPPQAVGQVPPGLGPVPRLEVPVRLVAEGMGPPVGVHELQEAVAVLVEGHGGGPGPILAGLALGVDRDAVAAGGEGGPGLGEHLAEFAEPLGPGLQAAAVGLVPIDGGRRVVGRDCTGRLPSGFVPVEKGVCHVPCLRHPAKGTASPYLHIGSRASSLEGKLLKEERAGRRYMDVVVFLATLARRPAKLAAVPRNQAPGLPAPGPFRCHAAACTFPGVPALDCGGVPGASTRSSTSLPGGSRWCCRLGVALPPPRRYGRRFDRESPERPPALGA